MPARILMLLSVACLVSSGCANFHASGAKAKHAGPNASRGRTIFAAQCSACHGAEGRGGPIGPSLRDERARKSAANILDAIENPTPPMPKLYPAQISLRDLKDVAAYVDRL